MDRLLITFLSLLLLGYSISGHAWLVGKDDQELSSYIDQSKVKAEEESELETISDKKLYKIIKEKTQVAKKRRIAELSPYWDKPQFSDNSRWVSYSKDKTIQRVVDYANNEIALTLPRYQKDGRVDFVMLREQASGQVNELLSTSISEAINNDPLEQVWSELSGGEEGVILDEVEVEDELILSELFDAAKPSRKKIDRLARELMDESYISYDKPVVASNNETLYSDSNSLSVAIELDKISLKVPLPTDRLMRKAKKYLPFVSEAAKEHNVPPHIVFAVIHTESNFNPLARSRIPAYGLMQVVPTTAGKDVSRFFYDNKPMTSKFLYDPENNIRVGTAYLRVVYYHYLKKIENPDSRLYCTIAAYNAGTLGVARAFVRKPSMNKAVAVINKMSSEEVLEKLLESLPAKETRDYLRRVLERAPHYSQFDELAISV